MIKWRDGDLENIKAKLNEYVEKNRIRSGEDVFNSETGENIIIDIIDSLEIDRSISENILVIRNATARFIMDICADHVREREHDIVSKMMEKYDYNPDDDQYYKIFLNIVRDEFEAMTRNHYENIRKRENNE